MPNLTFQGVNIRILLHLSKSRWEPHENQYFDADTGVEYDEESLGVLGRGHQYELVHGVDPEYLVLTNNYRAWDAESWPALYAADARPMKTPPGGKPYGPGDFRTDRVLIPLGGVDALKHIATLDGWELNHIRFTDKTYDVLERADNELTSTYPNKTVMEQDLNYLNAILRNVHDPELAEGTARKRLLKVTAEKLRKALGKDVPATTDHEIANVLYDMFSDLCDYGSALSLIPGGVRLSFPKGNVILRPDGITLTTEAGTSNIAGSKKKSRLQKIKKKSDDA